MKLKKVILSAVLAAWGLMLPAQIVNFEWADQSVVSGGYFGASAIATDDTGNVYCSGYFSGTADVDPGPGIHNLVSAGGYDIYLNKISPSGNLIWSKQISSAVSEESYNIMLDATGNIYISGVFRSSLDIDPGPGVTMLTGAGATDAYLAKYDNAGNLLWADAFGSAGNENFYKTAIDAFGNIIVGGIVGGVIDADPGPAVVNTPFNGSVDCIFIKLNSAGNYIWSNVIGSSSLESIGGISCDANNDIYICGYFNAPTDFDAGTGSTILTPAGSRESFVCKYTAAGNFSWAAQLTCNAWDGANGLGIDPAGNVIVSGYFNNVIDLDPGTGVYNVTETGAGNDIYLCRLSPSGQFLNGASFGGSDYEYQDGFNIDSHGNVYLTGGFSVTTDFDPGVGIYQATAVGSSDIYILKTDSLFNFKWVQVMYGASSASYGYGNSMATDRFNNVFCYGEFDQQIDFDPTSGVYNLNSASGQDGVLIKLSQCNHSTSAINIQSCSSYSSPSGNYTWTSSGTYLDTIPNTTGCDSIITINLTVNNPSTSSFTASACNSFTSPSGHNWNSSGIYLDTIPNIAGCDSIITVNLTILNSTSASVSPVVCNSFTSPSGHNWTSSGIYFDTIPNIAGCDSIITVNLTILNSTSASVSPVVCNSFTSPSGHNWTSSGIYLDTIPNIAGCDSIITIDLTVISSSASSITTSACSSYTSPSGQNLTSSGTYLDTIPNAAGCDSVITINLTILPQPDLSLTNNSPVLSSNQTGANYQWIDCSTNSAIAGATGQSFTATVNGNYAVVVTLGSCTDTSSCANVNNIGITEGQNNNPISIYPNPTEGTIHIRLSDSEQTGTILIYNPVGQVVYSKTISGTSEAEISIPGSAGFYLLELHGENGQISRVKILKN